MAEVNDYTTLKTALDDARVRLDAEVKRLRAAKAAITAADTAIGNLPSQYSGIASAINAFGAANSEDPAAIALKAEKDQLVANFTARKTTSASLKSAADAINV